MDAGRYKTKPMAHQLANMAKRAGREAFGDLSEMGTGKTWVAINEIAQLWGEGNIHSVLVLAPNGVHSNWVYSELPKHMPEWVDMRCAAFSGSAKKKQLDAVQSILDTARGPLRILTMNWDSIRSERGFEIAMQFCRTAAGLAIYCDESHFVKNPSTQTYKALEKLKRYASIRRIMSGTVILNAPFDAFSQFSFLDEEILGTTSFYAFKNEYAEMLSINNPLVEHVRKKAAAAGRRPSTPQIVARGARGEPKYRNLEQLQALIEPHTFRVLKSECIDLPEKIYKTAYFELSPAQRKMYDSIKNDLRIILADGESAPVHALAALTKLAQVSSGFIITPEGIVERIPGPNPKLSLLEERIASAIDSGEQVIVWARFIEEIRAIAEVCDKLKASHVIYDGSTGADARVEAVRRFEAGDYQVFIGNQQAGGTGITLVAASTVIYFSNTFNLGHRLQSEDRAHRIGQTRHVVYEDLIANGTIDPYIVGALKRKESMAQVVNGDALRAAILNPAF
jgi:SNF2 family DNA or RNA helicase